MFEIINQIFGRLKAMFTNFFGQCEQGFENELIINMFLK